ncbi:MAG: hypothetical protein WBO54_06675 [Thermoanaerobaculia bacterium]
MTLVTLEFFSREAEMFVCEIIGLSIVTTQTRLRDAAQEQIGARSHVRAVTQDATVGLRRWSMNNREFHLLLNTSMA